MSNFASEFPITQNCTYLNTAAQGPWPTRTVRAVQEIAAQHQFIGPDSGGDEAAIFGKTRQQLGRLLNVQPDQIVFGPNTTYGLNVCTHGIDWRAGDNIVLPEREFPSVQAALAHLPALGVEVRVAAWQGAGVTVNEIMARVDGRTRAVICSAIAWNTGYRIDLEGLGRRCAEVGVLLIVDGIHSVGAECLDLQAMRVSALSFHGYKWLLAGFGIGGLYVSPDALNHIRPTFVGPQAVAGGSFFEPMWKPNAQRYAAGGGNKIGITALNSALSLIEEMGIAAIRAANHGLANALHAGLKRHLPDARVLRSDDPQHQSCIVVFTSGSPEGDSAILDKLNAQNILVAQRPAGIRVSPHLFNTEGDIERLLAALAGDS